MDAERQSRRDLRQRRIRAFATCQAISNDADVVPTIDLAVCKVENVPKYAADRSSHRMEDFERPVRRWRHVAVILIVGLYLRGPGAAARADLTTGR
ncbi:hypothetical protein SSBR45G_07120 [Bradyrhizobium sp. SSBR45G]|nr:hypothetical protein SSBR45G_07120 [Bradyrhizobium sp. SSBR45G]GLH85041.1 hypothetical protein SSBR45R_25010 [Bradyrhizobium sp. SSBR45R]